MGFENLQLVSFEVAGWSALEGLIVMCVVILDFVDFDEIATKAPEL